jgi:RES domain-containing protein
MTRVWRLCKKRWAGSAMSGRGAAENPGRWNSLGRKAVYCAESRALAALEVMAHTHSKRRLRKAGFVAIPIDVPDELINRPAKFPAGWAEKPIPPATRAFGDRLMDDPRFPVCRLPSAVVNGEFCFIINPEHPRYGELRVGNAEAFSFDERVL